MPQHVWLVHTCCGVTHTVQWLRFCWIGNSYRLE
jgi:hypothetical protein